MRKPVRLLKPDRSRNVDKENVTHISTVIWIEHASQMLWTRNDFYRIQLKAVVKLSHAYIVALVLLR